jgi:hypothetical protein
MYPLARSGIGKVVETLMLTMMVQSQMREMAVLKRSELAKFPFTFNPITSQTATKLLAATAMIAR